MSESEHQARRRRVAERVEGFNRAVADEQRAREALASATVAREEWFSELRAALKAGGYDRTRPDVTAGVAIRVGDMAWWVEDDDVRAMALDAE